MEDEERRRYRQIFRQFHSLCRILQNRNPGCFSVRLAPHGRSNCFLFALTVLFSLSCDNRSINIRIRIHMRVNFSNITHKWCLAPCNMRSRNPKFLTSFPFEVRRNVTFLMDQRRIHDSRKHFSESFCVKRKVLGRDARRNDNHAVDDADASVGPNTVQQLQTEHMD